MNKNFIKILLVALTLAPIFAKGQSATDTVPYCCDFESSVEQAYWRFANTTTSNANKWVLGTSTQTGQGVYSIYISNDGISHNFSNIQSCSYAYRRLHIPAGVYEVSYDWVAKGYQAGSNYYSYMRAFLIPVTTTFTGGQLLTGLSATGLPAGAIALDPGRAQCGVTTWQSYVNPIVYIGNGGDYFLVFVWYNNTSASTSYQPPAAVDNICILPVSCPSPWDITRTYLSNGCMALSWTDWGNPAGWIIEYGGLGFTPGTGTQRYTTSKPDTICGLLPDTIYDFYVRAVCDSNDTSKYSSVIHLRYCEQNINCIDFTNLNSPDVTCTYGKFSRFGNYSAGLPGPYANRGIRNPNNGHGVYSVSEGASHTVLTDVTEKDSLSGFQLYTIPSGSCESVRLGCAYGSNLCQASAYKFHVDTLVSDIALVNYAVVLVDPTNPHDSLSEPRFLFEVLDSTGRLINPTCGYSNINVSVARQTWNRGITISGGHQVYWKDWSPIGLDLSGYHGQTITIRITVFACGAGAVDHSGYMYYTLGCSKARIIANTCGDRVQTATLTAPAGFLYRWYNNSIPGWTSNQQTITVNMDSSEYFCDVMFYSDTTCYFTISTLAAPR
ncbi:MAG: fibronectin type III domain-containing protein, partial [Bacteroidales bacterium]|nr:fibronectin type III domain-containing protein [Bacteroidales bacterium]